jgi:hypothetical protein
MSGDTMLAAATVMAALRSVSALQPVTQPQRDTRTDGAHFDAELPSGQRFTILVFEE